MSTYLELCADLHREARYAGSAPTTVIGQAGQALDIVSWIREAYNEIQRENDGHWRWLWHTFEVDTVVSEDTYSFSDCTDITIAVPATITRWHEWLLNDRRNPPKCFLTALGKNTEYWLIWMPWEDFKQVYKIAQQNPASPVYITIDPQDNIVIGPAASDIFTITGDFWLSEQILAADGDVPEMPASYHQAIVWKALLKYAYSNLSPEQLAKASEFGDSVTDALELNQGAKRIRFRKSSPLA